MLVNAIQDKLSADSKADNLPQKWKRFSSRRTHLQEQGQEGIGTILQKHLRAHTAKYLFDYFIHKDLGGFLKRELDFYIKNEVMHRDIENTPRRKPEHSLFAIRRCAMPIIACRRSSKTFRRRR